MSTFTFKLIEKPPRLDPIKYVIDDNTYITVKYDPKSWGDDINIHGITIHKSLAPGAIVPRAMGSAGPRGLLTTQSIQITYGNIPGCFTPPIKVGQSATLVVKNLVAESDVNLRFDKCILTIEEKSYTLIPKDFIDNRVTNADCSKTGGNYKEKYLKYKKKYIQLKTSII